MGFEDGAAGCRPLGRFLDSFHDLLDVLSLVHGQDDHALRRGDDNEVGDAHEGDRRTISPDERIFRVDEDGLASGEISAPCSKRTARWMVFSSSRTLPRQG